MRRRSRPAVERVTPPPVPFAVVNRVVQRLLTSPRAARRVGQHLLLLHVTGRKSGQPITVPVAYRRAPDGRLLVLTNSAWRVNLRDRPQVQVTLLGARMPASAQLVEDPETVAVVYQDLLQQEGTGKASRRLGVRMNVDRVPTLAELEQAAHRDSLCAVYLRLGGATA